MTMMTMTRLQILGSRYIRNPCSNLLAAQKLS